MPPHGWRTQFWVVDQNNKVLVGPRRRFHLTVHGDPFWSTDAEVGAVIASPVERLTRNTDINFDKQQRQTSWLIVALATLLAFRHLSAGAWSVGGQTLGGRAAHKLAAGDFTTRVTPTSEDELGKLAQDFLDASTLEKKPTNAARFYGRYFSTLHAPLAVLRGELETIQDGVRKFTRRRRWRLYRRRSVH